MKQLERYQIPNCRAKIMVNIVRNEDALATEYLADFPRLGEGTRLAVNEIKIEILSRTKVAVEKMADLKFAKQVRADFEEIAEGLLKKKIPFENRDELEVLKEILINEMLGLGNIDYLLLDDNIEEIVINSSAEPAWIYHKKYGWLKSNLLVDSEKEIENISSIIARRAGKQINVLSPLLDAYLPTGDRANSTLNPISSKGNTITIRRFRRKPWTVSELISFGSITSEAMALVWMAFEYELNVLITGGTASGKTSFLNACASFIRPNQRVITIEDTRELTLPTFLHWVPLATRLSNTEGKGEISMLDLLVNSLRMRPDRIIVGEVRRQREAEVMFEAMNTGHSVYTTFHADTAEETIRRFSNPPISLPESMLDSIALNIVLFRNRKSGTRSVYQIAEIVVEDRGDEREAKSNVLYKYDSIRNKLLPYKASIKFFDEVSMHTGLTQGQIEDEIKEKQKILEWLVEQKVFELEDLALVFAKYYFDKDKIIAMAKEGKNPRTLLKKRE
jgi:flagellar protein FlaI